MRLITNHTVVKQPPVKQPGTGVIMYVVEQQVQNVVVLTRHTVHVRMAQAKEQYPIGEQNAVVLPNRAT